MNELPILPHDSSGFLTGGERLISGMDEVKKDTHAILSLLKNAFENQFKQVQGVRKTLERISQNTRRTVEAGAPTPNPPMPPTREAAGQESPVPSPLPPTVDSGASNPIPPREAVPPIIDSGVPPAPNPSPSPLPPTPQGGNNPSPDNSRRRDSNGRFSGDGTDNKKQSFWDGIKKAVRGGVLDANADTENIDPTVDAVRELGDALSPLTKVGKVMFKGAAWLFGRKKKQPPPSDQEQRQQSRIEKLLKRISESRVGVAARSGSNLLSGIGGGLSSLGGMIAPFIMRALPAALGITAAFKLGEWIGGKIYDFIEPALSPLIDGIAAIPETISNAWQGVVDIASKGIESVVDGFKSAKDKVTGAYESTVEAASKGIENVANGAKGVASWGKGIYEKAVSKTSQVIEKGVNTARYVKQSVQESGRSAMDSLTGKKAERRQALVSEMQSSGITDPTEKAMFMAQMDHESGGFGSMEESFNYRTADSIAAVSKSAAKHGQPAIQAAMSQGPEAVAELMYGGRMGNTEKGDAYKYRGRGHTQLTGKANYEAAGKDLGLDLVNNPDLVKDPKIAAKVATWYWKKNKIGEAARAGDTVAVRKKVNGGLNGLEDTQSKFADYLTDAKTGKLGGVPSTQSAPNDTTSTSTPTMAAKPIIATTQQTPARQDFATTAQPIAAKTVTATPIAPRATPVVMAKAVPDVPKVQQQVSSSSRKPQSATMGVNEQIGQNISDRHLAHAVTGGLGMDNSRFG
jgi:predicted chitinase